jgi:hypothetical protein
MTDRSAKVLDLHNFKRSAIVVASFNRGAE